MRLNESRRVHLDHLIKRESIRYYDKGNSNELSQAPIRPSDNSIRYSDITSDWFVNIRKPDFQRETNAWSPEQCLEFIESAFLGRIIPSIILWKSKDNGLIYVLDGAHRLSIIRSWMTDDYGDKNLGYYERRDINTIKRVAEETRNLINSKIGSYSDLKIAYDILREHTRKGKAPKKEMSDKQFRQANFYSDIIGGNASLYAQWEHGGYESAEQSFLRINRQGQPLDPWESILIEFRKGSYSRVIMHIANGGQEGYFWPITGLTNENEKIVFSFREKARSIHNKLFIPPFSIPIKELSVPLLVAPAYFQKHVYLLEFIPLVIWGNTIDNKEQQIEFLSKDYQKDVNEVIENGNDILNKLDEKIEHIVSPTNGPKSLSMVPLFYWYNERGQFIRSLFYGWIYWLFQGNDTEVFNRKLIYSANRGNIELIFFEFKKEIASYAAKSGAGLKAVKSLAIFYERLITFFFTNRETIITSDLLENEVLKILGVKRQKKSIRRTGRNSTTRDKTQSNINEIFDSSVKCHICQGIVDLKFGGIQYDHVKKYKDDRVTDPENLKPTHPFCNNNRDKIEKFREGTLLIDSPLIDFNSNKLLNRNTPKEQLSLFVEDFPE